VCYHHLSGLKTWSEKDNEEARETRTMNRKLVRERERELKGKYWEIMRVSVGALGKKLMRNVPEMMKTFCDFISDF
jgi:hypothetical protein